MESSLVVECRPSLTFRARLSSWRAMPCNYFPAPSIFRLLRLAGRFEHVYSMVVAAFDSDAMDAGAKHAAPVLPLSIHGRGGRPECRTAEHSPPGPAGGDEG